MAGHSTRLLDLIESCEVFSTGNCPKCNAPIGMSQVQPKFLCSKCGTELRANTGIALAATIFFGGMPFGIGASFDSGWALLAGALVTAALSVAIWRGTVDIRAGGRADEV